MSLKNPQNRKKMLRKSPTSNTRTAIFKNAGFSLEVFENYKIE